MKDLKLFINKMEADIDDSVSILYDYTYEMLENPTAIKTAHSKTVTLKATKTNNKIFNHFYQTNRLTDLVDGQYGGVNYSPLKRVPFEVVMNGALVESGYIQLNKVNLNSRDNSNSSYEITMYSDVADFFYNLAYDDEYTPKKLSDLDFKMKYREEWGQTVDEEMDFYLQSENMAEIWSELKLINNEEWDEQNVMANTVNFAPCYNGTYDNFDNNKVIINTFYADDIVPSTVKDEDGVEWGTYNGYLLAESDTDYTEWDLRMLKSYEQRPVLRVKKFIKAICDPDNNGGYEVELTDKFFNKDNPYYQKAWFMFPLLNTNKDYDVSQNTVSGSYTSSKMGAISSSDTYITSTVPSSITPNTAFNVKAYMSAKLDTSKIDDVMFPYGTTVNYKPQYNNLVMQIIVEDENGRVMGYSPIYAYNKYKFADMARRLQVDTTNFKGDNIKYIDGRYLWDDNQNAYIYTDFDGNNQWEVNFNATYTEGVKIRVHQEIQGTVSSDDYLTIWQSKSMAMWPSIPNNNITAMINSINVSYLKANIAISSNSKVSKADLLRSDKTPLDFLLSYSKQFGLLWLKDPYSKKIKVLTRNEFFSNGENIDLNDRIDWSKSQTITPLLFDSKFFLMKNADYNGKYNERYKTKYGVEYGQKRIDTNYRFNNNTNELTEDNILQNIVTMRGNSKYLNLYETTDSDSAPSMLTDDLKVTYYRHNDASDEWETYTVDYPRYSLLKSFKSTPLWERSNYDYTPKMCCFSGDNELEDIDASICFLNEVVEATVPYRFVDDPQEVLSMNDGKMCHLWTDINYSEADEFIGCRIFNMPIFTRRIEEGNNVEASFDYGQPNELYEPFLKYKDNATLYDAYWGKLLTDQTDKDCKMLECYVNLKGMNIGYESLGNFYFFNNTQWILNKINSYSLTDDVTTKCTFIRVMDEGNYTDGQYYIGYSSDEPSSTYYINAANDEFNHGYASTTNGTTITTNDPQGWKFRVTLGSPWLTAQKGNNSQITIHTAENTDSLSRMGTIEVYCVSDESIKAIITVNQKANSSVKYITAEPSSLMYEDGGSKTSVISTNDEQGWSFHVSNDVTDWVSAEKVGDNILQITCAANTTGADRVGRVQVYCNSDNTVYKYIAVAQSAAAYSTDDEPTVDPYINVSRDTLSFEAERGSDTVTIETRDTDFWSFSSSDSWLTPSIIADGVLRITVAENEVGERSGSVTVYLSNDKSISKTITVTQKSKGGYYINIEPTQMNFTPTENNNIVTVDSNGTVVVENNFAWASVEEVSSDVIYQVGVSANNTYAQRTAQIRFYVEEDPTKSVVLSVNQDCDYYLNVSPSEYEVSKNAATYTYAVDTNASTFSYEIEGGDWVTAEIDGSHLKVTVAENDGEERMEKIIFTIPNDVDVTAIATLVQQAADTPITYYITTDFNTVSVDHGVHTQTVEVDTNDEQGWSVNTYGGLSDWVTCSNNNGNLVLAISANLEESRRRGYIELYCLSDTTKTQRIAINQSGKPSTDELYLTISEDDGMFFSNSASSLTNQYDTNDPSGIGYKMDAESDEWIRVEIRDDALNVSVAANTDGGTRIGRIKVYCISDESVYKYLPIYQGY